MADKYNPEIGDIWWDDIEHRHILFLAKEIPDTLYTSSKWSYTILNLESGQLGNLLHNYMNHGLGSFRKVA